MSEVWNEYKTVIFMVTKATLLKKGYKKMMGMHMGQILLFGKRINK